jgi:hypothetical protein
MSHNQIIILGAIIFFTILHLIRDLMQEFHIRSLLTNIWTKHSKQVPHWYWHIFGSSLWLTAALVSAAMAFIYSYFIPFGILSVISLLVFEVAWVIYWFMMK